MERIVAFDTRLNVSRDAEIIERFLAINIDKFAADAEYDFEFKQKTQTNTEIPKPKMEPIKKKSKFKNVAAKVKKTKKVAKVISQEKKEAEINMQQKQQKEQQQQSSSVENEEHDETNVEDKIKQFLNKDNDDNLELQSQQPQADDPLTQEIKKSKKKRRRSKYEEMFTDKDRAAAVNLGSKDIKQSLKIKRKMDRSAMLHIPDEAEPGTFLALGNYEMLKGDYKIALDFMNKALELNPTEKDALVARSKCYILMGQPENGLKDAESALAIDKNCMKAVYQKAESLYYLGDFEHSLMYYHRGLRHRPDHDGFKLGVQKAQKAIENAIGGQCPWQSRSSSRKTNASSKTSSARAKTDVPVTPDSGQTKTEGKGRISRTSIKSTTTSAVRGKSGKRNRLLRELAPDKEYLNNLLINPNIKCKFKENNDDIINCIKEAVGFLNTREEFWRQQLPAHLK